MRCRKYKSEIQIVREEYLQISQLLKYIYDKTDIYNKVIFCMMKFISLCFINNILKSKLYLSCDYELIRYKINIYKINTRILIKCLLNKQL